MSVALIAAGVMAVAWARWLPREASRIGVRLSSEHRAKYNEAMANPVIQSARLIAWFGGIALIVIGVWYLV